MGNIASELSENTTTQDTSSAPNSINDAQTRNTESGNASNPNSTNVRDIDTPDVAENIHTPEKEYNGSLSQRNNIIAVVESRVVDMNNQEAVSTEPINISNLATQGTSEENQIIETESVPSSSNVHIISTDTPDIASNLNIVQEPSSDFISTDTPGIASNLNIVQERSSDFIFGNINGGPLFRSNINNMNIQETATPNTHINTNASVSVFCARNKNGMASENSAGILCSTGISTELTPNISSPVNILTENKSNEISKSNLVKVNNVNTELVTTSTSKNNSNISHASSTVKMDDQRLEETATESFLLTTPNMGIQEQSPSLTNTEMEITTVPQLELNEEFKLELDKKHEKRRQLIAEKRREMKTIREELDRYKTENYNLKRGVFSDHTTQELDTYKTENDDLKCKLANATANVESSLYLKTDIEVMRKEIEQYKQEKKNAEKTLQELQMCKKENEDLKSKLTTAENLKEENEDLKLEVEKLKLELKNSEEIISKNKELRISLAEMQGEVQNMNIELLNIEQERMEYGKHIGAMKDVVRVTKEMLAIRETQIEELKGKIKTVEDLLASKEMKIMSDGLREEYERQLRNIRNLRNLYEERQRLDKKDKENLQEQLDESKKQVEDEQKKNSELQERVIELEKETSLKYDTITSLQSNLGLSKAECKELQAEINIINQLFSEILLGFKNTQEIDLDKLIKLLEENHDLLTNMATNEESNSTSAALPKLLLDLINQMNKADEASSFECSEIPNQDSNQLNSAEEIVETLPKVWKVLMELLSHQNPPLNALFGASQEEPCYKLIETSKGAKLKLSVSQTFIRLKDLILEKKFLERETYRLKHLNTHLECRLQDQEKRLELVSGEVKNTWHVVDKMQRQHQQLHTHEKVLRYELQEKRKLLNELKEDLQYCREKWVEARAKNDTTHSQWKELRKEFADRKNRSADEFNQSAESGYSDGKDSSEDERGYESDVSEGKHETDVETDGDQKTESVQIDEKRQLVQNELRLECVVANDLEVVAVNEEVELAASTGLESNAINATNSAIPNEDLSIELASGEEIELTANHGAVDLSNGEVQLIPAHEVVIGTADLRLTGRNSHIEAGTKRLENLLEAREIRLKEMEEIGSQLVARAVCGDAVSRIEYKSGTSASTSKLNTGKPNEPASENMSSEAQTNTLPIRRDTAHGSKIDNAVSSDIENQSFDKKIQKDESLQLNVGNSENVSTSITLDKSDVVEANLILDREVQELFDEMCKFVEQGTDADIDNQVETRIESEEVLSAREERLHRLEEEFKEVTEFDSNETNEQGNIVSEEITIGNVQMGNQGLEEKETIDQEIYVANCALSCEETTSKVEQASGITKDDTSTSIQNESVDANSSLSVDIVHTENKLESNDIQLSSSVSTINEASNSSNIEQRLSPQRSTEEILLRREERLKRLEAQSKILLAKTRKTTQRSNVISDKLDELHEIYGDSSNEALNNVRQDSSSETVRKSRKFREEILIQREVRLRKLDMQCKALLGKILKRTENKNSLEELERAGNSTNEGFMVAEKKFNESDGFRIKDKQIKINKTVLDVKVNAGQRDNGVVLLENNSLVRDTEADNIKGSIEESEASNFRKASVNKNEKDELIVGLNGPLHDTTLIKTDITQGSNITSDGLSTSEGELQSILSIINVIQTDSDITNKISTHALSSSDESKLSEVSNEASTRNYNENERILTILQLSNDANLEELEQHCKCLLVDVRNPRRATDGERFTRKQNEIVSALVILLPRIIKSVQDEIFALKLFYASFPDDDEREMLDEAASVDNFAGITEKILDDREGRFWKLGEQFWEIVNAVTIDDNYDHLKY